MGYDAGKEVKGRKARALVDVEGLPLRVVVHSAGIQDRAGSALVLDRIRERCQPLGKRRPNTKQNRYIILGDVRTFGAMFGKVFGP